MIGYDCEYSEYEDGGPYDDAGDYDMDTCLCCGRVYATPHQKQIEWEAEHPRPRADIMPQRCPRCWEK